MRYLSASLLLGSLIGAAFVASPAEAAPVKPCGTYTLYATNAAAADSFDANGDRLECHPAPVADEDPYSAAGTDNRRLLPAGSSFSGYKFYSFGDAFSQDTGVTWVNAARNRFKAWVVGQEDDPDMNGCVGRCFERLSYDANDFFYVDFGNGSRHVSLATFEQALPGSDRFTIIYDPGAAHTNVFSLDKSQG